jgi:hypothetical protein
MSEKRAVYRGGSGTGVDLSVPLGDGQHVPVHVDQGAQLPTEIEYGGVKHKVPASFRDSLLEQDDWSEVNQATGPKADGDDDKKGA